MLTRAEADKAIAAINAQVDEAQEDDANVFVGHMDDKYHDHIRVKVYGRDEVVVTFQDEPDEVSMVLEYDMLGRFIELLTDARARVA